MAILSNRELAEMQGLLNLSMDYTCTIERPTTTGIDEHGQPLPISWTLLITNQKCAYQSASTGARQGELIQEPLIYSKSLQHLYLPYGISVLETDRITNLVDRYGTPASPVSYYEIKQITRSEITTDLTLESIS